MGNRNLYHFCLAILILLDIVVPLALLAVAAKTAARTTLTFCPVPAAPQEAPQIAGPEKPAPPLVVAEKIAPPPAAAQTMFVGQA